MSKIEDLRLYKDLVVKIKEKEVEPNTRRRKYRYLYKVEFIFPDGRLIKLRHVNEEFGSKAVDIDNIEIVGSMRE